jgi:hypothetical protein
VAPTRSDAQFWQVVIEPDLTFASDEVCTTTFQIAASEKKSLYWAEYQCPKGDIFCPLIDRLLNFGAVSSAPSIGWETYFTISMYGQGIEIDLRQTLKPLQPWGCEPSAAASNGSITITQEAGSLPIATL